MKLTAFLKERFPPGPYVILVGLTMAVSGADVLGRAEEFVLPLAGFVLFLLFFFRLRLFDEIKDYETDVKWRPERIVARGDVGLSDIRLWLGVTILLEILLLMMMPQPVQFWYLAASAWSVLMFYEFFVPKWLERHFVIYGISHVIVMAPLALAMRSIWLTEGDVDLLHAWPIMVGITAAGYLFEIGRKMRRPDEEQEGVDTYTGKLGVNQAGIWLIIWIGLTWWALSQAFNEAALITGIAAGLTAIYLGLHIWVTRWPLQKPIEIISSVFVMLIYLIILISYGF